MDNKYARIIKFLISGSIAALINLILIYMLIEYLSFKTALMQNIANAISMEASVILNFFISRHWTWNDSEKLLGYNLFKQLIAFHFVVGISIVMRLILFPLLQFFGIIYIFNTIIGIGIGSIINYILYDRYIFKKGVLV